jgi:hypothetical protein
VPARPGGQPEDRPRRIRRRRTKGWTLAAATKNPSGAIAVDRTSRWGNPHAVRRVGDDWTVIDPRSEAPSGLWPSKGEAQAVAVDRFRAYLAEQPELVAAAREQLAGRDLACYCGDEPCHAEVWLEIVNEGPELWP